MANADKELATSALAAALLESDGFSTEANVKKLLAASDAPLAVSEILQKAASGDTRAMWCLYNMYDEGALVGEDRDTALEWLCRADDAGFVQARQELRELGYEKSEGAYHPDV
jgi:TPR repeat protein